MTSSVLVPPNRSLLRDTVIGDVVQRLNPLHVHHKHVVGQKRRQPPLWPVENNVGDENFTSETTGEREMKISARRRERCRLNQAKYRKRQRQRSDNLNASTKHLQEEIESLETQRQEILRSAPAERSLWVVATEYFRMFRHGYMAPTFAPDSPSAITTKVHQHVQLHFLKSNMTTDVTDGILCGPEELLENWKLFSKYHDHVKVLLKRLQLITHDSLVAIFNISFTITENTLRNLYPYVELESSLALKLLNQRLVVRGSVRFDWNEHPGRVVRLETKMDMVTPMLKLLGNVENVASVFDQACISLDGRFRFNSAQ